MDHDNKKLKGIIIHPWNTKRIYKVHHERKISIENFPRKIISDFKIELTCLEQPEGDPVWQIDKTNLSIASIDEKNMALGLLKQLEEFTYPISVIVDSCGNLIKISNHKNWVENWRLKAKQLAIEEYDIDGDIEIFQKFYETLHDEKKFIENKNKEAFWKLLFLNFKIAVPLDAEYGSKEFVVWDLLQLETKKITGISKGSLSGPDFIQQFRAGEYLGKEIIETATAVYGLKPVYDMYSPRIEVKIDIITDNTSRRLKSKTAFVELVIEDQFSYSEEISIILSDETA
jgi:hypothetical protein